MSPEHQYPIIELVDDLTKVIGKYFLTVHNINLGNIDMSSYMNFCYVDNQNLTEGGSVQLSGKQSNNIFCLRKRDVIDYINNTGNGFNTMRFHHIIIHEILHKLFNLDNRLDIIIGENPSANLISKSKREGSVEYFASKITIELIKLTGLDKEHNLKINFSSKNILISTANIFSCEEYGRYVVNLENYLQNLTLNFKESELNTEHCDLKNSRIIIEQLFAEFFLAGDRGIIDLAQSLGVKNILDN